MYIPDECKVVEIIPSAQLVQILHLRNMRENLFRSHLCQFTKNMRGFSFEHVTIFLLFFLQYSFHMEEAGPCGSLVDQERPCPYGQPLAPKDGPQISWMSW